MTIYPIVSKRDPAGRVTQIEYNSAGHPSLVTDAAGSQYTFEYQYNSGQKEYYRQTTAPSGMVKEIWVNKDGETTRVDINGRTVKKLNKTERRLTVTDEKGNTTVKYYDEWENVVEIRYPDNSKISVEYEPRFNRPTRFTDRLGNVTTYEYDQSGNLLRKTEAVDTPVEKITTFTYDAQHQLLTVTQQGDANTSAATSSFTYDSKGNIASITDALGHRLEVLSYDIAGNPLTIKDYRGFIWHYNYDADEQLKSVTNPLGQITQYEYDATHNLTAIVDEAGNRWSFAYNLRVR